MADIQAFDFDGSESNIIEVIERLYLLKDSDPALVQDFYDSMGIDTIIKAAEHLEKTELYLLDLENNLDKVLKYLTEINALSQFYPKLDEGLQKLMPKKITALVTYIERIFEDSIYNSMNFLDSWWSPLTNFHVFTGRHIDQLEKFQFSRHFISPKMSLEELQIFLLLDVEDPVVWSTICREANKRIVLEKMQIRAYIKRLVYIKRFFYIQETFAETDDQLLVKPVADLHKQLTIKAGAYLDLSEDLLEDIKSKAEERLRELEEDNTSSPDRLLFETEALVDEVNRMASHASFNGITLLTGRWKEGMELTEDISFKIPPMTAHTFFAESRGLDWYGYDYILEDYSDQNRTKEFLATINTALQSVRQAAVSIEEARKKLPAASYYHPIPYEDEVNQLIEELGFTDEGYTLFTDLLPDNNNYTLAALHSAENGIRYALDMIRKIHNRVLQGGNSAYTNIEKVKFQEQLVSLLDELQYIIENTGINGSALFGRGEYRFQYLISGKDSIKEGLDFRALDLQSLGFSESGYNRGLSAQNEQDANYSLMQIDMARRMLRYMGNTIHFQKITAYIAGEYQKSISRLEYILENGADRNNLASEITTILSILDKTARRIEEMETFTRSQGVIYWTKEIVTNHINQLYREMTRPVMLVGMRLKQYEERSGEPVVYGEMVLTETLETLEQNLSSNIPALLGISQIRDALHPFSDSGEKTIRPGDYLDDYNESYGDEGDTLKTLQTLEDILENLSKGAKEAFTYLDTYKQTPELPLDIEETNRFLGETSASMQNLLNAAEFDGSFIFQGGSASVGISDGRIMNLSFRNIRFATATTISSDKDLEEIYQFFKSLRGALLQNRELIRFYIDIYKNSILLSQLKGLNSLEDCKRQVASLEISLISRVRRYIQLILNDGLSDEFKNLYKELGAVIYQEVLLAYGNSTFNGEKVFNADEMTFLPFPEILSWFEIRKASAFLDNLNALEKSFQDILKTTHNQQ